MFGLWFGLVWTIGCQGEIDGKEAATVKEVPEQRLVKKPNPKDTKIQPQNIKIEPGKAEPSKEAQPPAGSMQLTSTSKVEWVGAKVTGEHSGGFKTVTGYAVQKEGKLVSLTADIDMNSLYSDSQRLTGHLRSDDFFSVVTYPSVSFTSSKIEGEKITGILEMRAIKKEISFPATIYISEQSIDIKAEFTINRRDWNVNYNGKANDLIKDDVLIKLDVQYK